ncbi:FkbM family methyltransferase [Aestuariivivens sediminis]|uniref:FkbM family methyltransferase n=1 Tax=Aestuariivivens sediminis TaxID=2913557 RepID=UPI001F567E13|nr:FkbM family methyltransferase [Aestuariivivens sediminis]
MPLKGFIQQKKLFRFYKTLINKNDLCFDIGANLGRKSKIFLSLGAKVIAFEPQSSCSKALLKIQNKNKDFTFIRAGVGESNGLEELFIGSHIEVSTFSKKFMRFFENEAIYWPHSEPIEVMTLNTILKTYGVPDYCKIDTEGYELKILESLNQPIPFIEFEFTSGFMDETIQIIHKLSSLGPTKWNYILNENPIFKLSNWVSSHEMMALFETLPQYRLHGNLYVKTEI